MKTPTRTTSRLRFAAPAITLAGVLALSAGLAGAQAERIVGCLVLDRRTFERRPYLADAVVLPMGINTAEDMAINTEDIFMNMGVTL